MRGYSSIARHTTGWGYLSQVNTPPIRISDQTRSSVQRLITSLEKQAETYGKSGVDRLITQRDQLLQRYNREPQAIDAITRSYEKMIAAEEKVAREALAVKAAKEAEEALRKQAESITSFGERVSQFMENPLQGAKGAVTSVMTALGPFGIAVTAGAAVLGTIAASAFEAAKSLGEYGTRVKDAELRTGLTAKEVGQFSFAARAVGQDISIVERLMRGLSQAANDNSTEGEKARATLRGMGIDFHTATGEMKPTSELLTEISEGLNKLPEGLQRDAAAMDLFKKIGIEAIPFMTELNENLRVAHEQGNPSATGVTSFNGRTGGVSPSANDYNFNQLAGAASVGQLPTGIPAPNIGGGSVGNTAFGYVANLTSDAQAQLNAKLAAANNLSDVGNASGRAVEPRRAAERHGHHLDRSVLQRAGNL